MVANIAINFNSFAIFFKFIRQPENVYIYIECDSTVTKRPVAKGPVRLIEIKGPGVRDQVGLECDTFMTKE